MSSACEKMGYKEQVLKSALLLKRLLAQAALQFEKKQVGNFTAPLIQFAMKGDSVIILVVYDPIYNQLLSHTTTD